MCKRKLLNLFYGRKRCYLNGPKIQNAVGSDMAVDMLGNHLSKDVTRDPKNSLDKVHRQVNKS